jgi:hypothetical protein
MMRQLQSIGPIGIAAIGELGKLDVFGSFSATWYTEKDGVYTLSIWDLVFYDRIHIGCLTVAKSKLGQINPKYLEQY